MKTKPQIDKESEDIVDSIELEAQRISDWINKQPNPTNVMQVFLVSCLMQLDVNGFEMIGMLEEAKYDVRNIYLECDCEGGEDYDGD